MRIVNEWAVQECLDRYGDSYVIIHDERIGKTVKHARAYPNSDPFRGFKGGPIWIDMEDDVVQLPHAYYAYGIHRIEPSFGGYKRTVDIGKYVLYGFFPYEQRGSGNKWLCSFDVLAERHERDNATQ